MVNIPGDLLLAGGVSGLVQPLSFCYKADDFKGFVILQPKKFLTVFLLKIDFVKNLSFALEI